MYCVCKFWVKLQEILSTLVKWIYKNLSLVLEMTQLIQCDNAIRVVFFLSFMHRLYDKHFTGNSESRKFRVILIYIKMRSGYTYR